MKNRKFKSLIALMVCIAMLTASFSMVSAKPTTRKYTTVANYHRTMGPITENVEDIFLRNKDTAIAFGNSLRVSNTESAFELAISTALGFPLPGLGAAIGAAFLLDASSKSNLADEICSKALTCNIYEGIRVTIHKYRSDLALVGVSYDTVSVWTASSEVPYLTSPYYMDNIDSF